MKKIIKKIIGDKKSYSLQHRVLNASMLLTVLISLFATISNYLLGLHWLSILIAFSGIIFFLFLYLLSFRANKFKLVSFLGLGVIIIIFFPLIWFSNEGSNGSSIYILFIILTALVTITKGVIRKVFLVILMFITISLYSVEFYYPEFLITYPSRVDRYLDLIFAFIIMVIGTTAYMNIYFTEYYSANKKLSEKNTLLEKKQEEIRIQQNKIEAQKAELEKKANDLQETNKTKDRFFSIIAHDLKNPFNALIGFSELIELAVENKDLEEIEKINKIVLQSSTQTHKLLLNLLEWSKAQTNQIQYSPEKIDVEKIINEQVNQFKYQAQKKGLILSAESTHCYVSADLNMLNTVLRNLLSNAIKYTKKGEITIKCTREKSNYKISISDTGVGISTENLKNMFDISESTSTSGTHGEKGTGLGLILCKEFIQKNKGAIFVESTVNKGSVFSFFLPLYKEKG